MRRLGEVGKGWLKFGSFGGTKDKERPISV